MSDEIRRLIRLARPDLAEWSTSDSAEEVLQRALSQGSRVHYSEKIPRRPSKRLVATAAFLIGAGAASVTAAYATGQFAVHPPVSDPTVACYSATSNSPPTIFVLNVLNPDAKSAESACSQQWPAAIGSSTPTKFVACVVPPYPIAKVFPALATDSAQSICSKMGGSPLG